MTKQSITYNEFSFGELSRNLFGRGSLVAYKSSAMNLTNMNVIQTGGIERRAGLRFVTSLSSMGKIITFEYASDKIFLLFFREKYIDIYNQNEELVNTIRSPYTLLQLSQIRWSQKGQDLYLVHPDVSPRIIRYNDITQEWKIGMWGYALHPQYNYSCQPYAKFPDMNGVTLTPTDTSGNIEIIASDDIFDNTFVGLNLMINGGQVMVTSIISDDMVEAEVIVNLTSAEEDENWQEPVFSIRRGYPSSVTFYQNRLVVGGSKSFKNRLWFSKVGEYLNFDLGTGLDDEAIELDIFSDKVNEIVSVFGGRHLQVFTSDSEWMVKGSPITPSNITVSQQTKIGSIPDRYIAPKFVEGSTIFVARNEKEVREFFYGDLSENYSSEDLILLSSHLLNHPIEQDYNIKKRQLYVLQADGTLAVLLTNKAHNINAWVQYKTDGDIISLAVVFDKTYVVVKRGEAISLEVFDDEFNLDCAKQISSNTPITTVTNLDFLNNKNVVVIADGEVCKLDVENNQIVLPKPAKDIIVGLPFTHIFCPLPVFIGSSFIPKAVRLLELNLRLMDTRCLQIDTGTGLKNIVLSPDSDFSGDIKVRGKGFIKNYEMPLFKIQSNQPYKLKILNMSMLIDVIR